MAGINFDAVYKHFAHVLVDKIQTNDTITVLKKFGVEAARNNLIKQIQNVFAVYGININYRHLSLIADFVTFNGDYRPFNRIGMEESTSPFLKMSFETTMQFLVGAAINLEKDDLSTPSSALVLG